jgi:tetratricopeptide (TPR) repeat protein
LRRALSIDDSLPGAHTTLGVVFAQTNRKAEAIEQWKRAVALDASEFDALYNLTVTLIELGRRDEAKEFGEQYIATAPPAFYAADIAKIQTLIR